MKELLKRADEKEPRTHDHLRQWQESNKKDHCKKKIELLNELTCQYYPASPNLPEPTLIHI